MIKEMTDKLITKTQTETARSTNSRVYIIDSNG